MSKRNFLKISLKKELVKNNERKLLKIIFKKKFVENNIQFLKTLFPKVIGQKLHSKWS